MTSHEEFCPLFEIHLFFLKYTINTYNWVVPRITGEVGPDTT